MDTYTALKALELAVSNNDYNGDYKTALERAKHYYEFLIGKSPHWTEES